jgi:integrase
VEKNFINTLIGRPNTVKTQKSLFVNHIQPYLPKHLNDLHGEFLARMTRMWIEKDLSAGTIKQLISLTRKYCLWATGRVPCGAATRRLVSRMEVPEIKTTWTPEQCRKVLEFSEAYNPALWRMILFTLHTGVRKGEMFGLRWEDVDFLEGRIRITRSYDGPTKTGKPRVIPISTALEESLLKDYTIGREDDLIFKRCDPNPPLEAMCTAAGVPRLTWHGLRHTFATLALEAKKSPKIVSTILGHSKVSTTLDLYWQLVPEEMDMDFLP